MALLSIPGGGREYCLQEYALPDFQFSFQFHGSHWRSVEYDWSYPEHEHPLFELNIVMEGHQITTLNGVQYDQSAGDLLIIRPGDLHSSRVGSSSGMTYFCLHLDIDDPSFFQPLNYLQQQLYPADSQLILHIRPALDRLIAASQKTNASDLGGKIEIRLAILYILQVLGELSSSVISLSEEKEIKSERKSSVDLAKFRETIILEKRVQDLFHEHPMPAIYIDESSFPACKWIGLISFTSPQQLFWNKPDRFWAKNLLEDALSPAGTVIIVADDRLMTGVIFSNQFTVPALEGYVTKAKQSLEQKLNIEIQVGFGGIASNLFEVSKLYRQSLQKLDSTKTDDSHDYMFEFIHRIIRIAMNYIQAEYATKELSLSLLAEKLDVSPNYLSSLFTNETGFTFTHHLSRIRIEKAKQLLRETSLKIYQICEEIGYTDQAYFSRLFKTIEGISPYDFRTQSRENKLK